MLLTQWGNPIPRTRQRPDVCGLLTLSDCTLLAGSMLPSSAPDSSGRTSIDSGRSSCMSDRASLVLLCTVYSAEPSAATCTAPPGSSRCSMDDAPLDWPGSSCPARPPHDGARRRRGMRGTTLVHAQGQCRAQQPSIRGREHPWIVQSSLHVEVQKERTTRIAHCI
jgi:hypothetical protein